MIIDRRTANPIARLRPIPETDPLRAFLLAKRQGAMDHLRKPRPHELMLESAHEIVESDPVFRIPRDR